MFRISFGVLLTFFYDYMCVLEPELELFEVWEINVRQIIIIANGINSKTPKLQTALARVLGVETVKIMVL